MNDMTLGRFIADGPTYEDASIDLEALIGGHLGVVANAGAGKSGLVRRLLEQTHGHVQQIILDPEDEFYTLRQGFSYVIAGGDDGDCPATVDNAAEMAIMLLTTGLDAIIQLNHLKAGQQEMFVANFLNAVMAAPQKLWHPCLFVIDEAHRWAPLNGGSLAFDAMKDFTSRGRKRGFTAVMATQRMAKIDRNVTDSVNNWALGRVGQATDRKTMADALGFRPSSDEARGLQSLRPRQFWVFGPAFAPVPRLIGVGDVTTAIVKAGQAKVPTPPAPEAVRKMLEGLKKPAPATTTPEKGPAAAGGLSKAEIDGIREKAMAEGRRQGVMTACAGIVQIFSTHLREFERAVLGELELMRPDGVITEQMRLMVGDSVRDLLVREPVPEAVAEKAPAKREPAQPRKFDGKISAAVQKIVAYYEAIYPRAVAFDAAAKQAGVGMRSSQYRTYEPELQALGVVEDLGGGRYRALRQVGSTDDYLDATEAQLSPKHKAVFKFIRRAGRPVTREEIVEAAEISPTSSTTSAALALLIKEAEVIEQVGDGYQLVEAYR